MQELAVYTRLLETELEKLEFPTHPVNLYEPLRYFLQIGGKRMRPILTLMGAELFGTLKENALPAALAVEIFHNFTLIHDDIMDAAPKRRNKETVHTKWNSNIAILSGDVLFVKGFQLLAKQQPDHLPALLDVFNTTAIEVCEGQQMDMDFESRENVSISEYIEMIRLKTSVLLGCALEMGAIIANGSKEDAKLLYNFGQHIGVAFQIQDDILDLYADPEKFGKQVGGDVISNKKTLLNLKAKEMADPVQLELLRQLSMESDLAFKVQKTREMYDQIGVKEACEAYMQEAYKDALLSIEQITVSESAKKPLLALAANLMHRDS